MVWKYEVRYETNCMWPSCRPHVMRVVNNDIMKTTQIIWKCFERIKKRDCFFEAARSHRHRNRIWEYVTDGYVEIYSSPIERELQLLLRLHWNYTKPISQIYRFLMSHANASDSDAFVRPRFNFNGQRVQRRLFAPAPRPEIDDFFTSNGFAAPIPVHQVSLLESISSSKLPQWRKATGIGKLRVIAVKPFFRRSLTNKDNQQICH